MLGNIDDLVGIEVKTNNGVVAFGMLGLFFDAQTVALLIKLSDAVALGIINPIAEDGSLLIFFRITYSITQQRCEAVAIKDVVAQHKAGTIITNEFLAYDKGLCETVRTGLLGILEVYAIVGAITQKALETRKVLRRGDNKNIPNPGQHQHGNRVIDHRLIENRKQLLAHSLRNGI